VTIFGITEPRLWTPPKRELTPETTRGFEAIAFAEEIIGITLTPWQRWLFIHALELNEDGTFRFRTIIVLIARQNGKTTWLQILALWCLYVEGAPLVLGTAQSLDLAEESWAGAVELAQGTPELAEEIEQVMMVNGKKQLKLVGGQRYKVQAATRRGGRGLSSDLVVLDELREHQSWDAWAAITKTALARRNALIVGLSNAGDILSIVLAHVRGLALRDIESGTASSLGLFEWSAPDDCALDDIDAIRQANPSMGYTELSLEAIEGARATDPESVFRTEVLCQWIEHAVESAFPADAWARCLDEESALPDGAPLVFSVDTSWDRSTSHIAVAGIRPDGKRHVEVIAAGEGTDWCVPWMQERVRRYAPLCVTVQGIGAPASSLVEELKAVGVPVVALGGTDIARACGYMHDSIVSGHLVHIGQPDVDKAVSVAVSRSLADAWALDRKRSPLDVAGLMAEIVALWALDQLMGSANYDVTLSVR
jgi:hypothetical protein